MAVEYQRTNLGKVRTMSEENPIPDSARVEALRSKARAGHKLTAEERLELFDADMKRVDELQAEQLKEAKANGTSVTRENRGWTREDLYNDDRGLPRGFPRGRK
jgi:translation initiation factor 1 (eIF-1/SUI1)